MPNTALPSHPLRVADLPARKPTRFDLRPNAGACAAIAAELGLGALRKLSFTGSLRAEGGRDWRLEATLGATVTQPCVVTLAPVTTRIDVPVLRRFLANMPDPVEEDGEAEIPEDDSLEELTEVIDPAAVMIEALALALPLFPRAPGAKLGDALFTAPGVEPLRDEDAKPFAGLADLKRRLAPDEDGGDGADET